MEKLLGLNTYTKLISQVFCLASQPHQSDWLVHLVALVLEWLHHYYEILHSCREEGYNGGGGGAVAFNNYKLLNLLDSECK